MNATFPNLSAATLRKATALAETIETKQAELAALLAGKTDPTVRVAKKCSKGCVRTPEQRAKISAGAKARWAARKAASAETSATPETPAA